MGTVFFPLSLSLSVSDPRAASGKGTVASGGRPMNMSFILRVVTAFYPLRPTLPLCLGAFPPTGSARSSQLFLARPGLARCR